MANLTDNTGGGSIDPPEQTDGQDSIDDVPDEEPPRKLRQDANSDPMREQTEPDNNSVSRTSPSGSSIDRSRQQDQQAVDRVKDRMNESSSGSGSGSRSSRNDNVTPTSGSSRQTYNDVVSDETKQQTTGGSPGDAQGTGLEDVGSPQERQQAREFEQRVISETAAEDSSDVRVTRDGDRLNAELSYSGREKVAAENLGVERDDISLRNGQVVADTGQGQDAINEAMGRNPQAARRAEQNKARAARLDLQGQSPSPQPRQQSGPVNKPTVRAVAKQQAAAMASEETGQTYRPEDVSVVENTDGSLDISVQEKETFDMDWSFGLGGPEDEVEMAIDNTANTIQQKGDQLGEALFGDESSGESAGEIVLQAAGQDQLATQYDANVRKFGKGAYSGAVSIANVPGLIGSGMELAEVGFSGAQSATSGNARAFSSKAYKRGTAIGESVVEEVTENPVSTAGMGTGALVGSYGIMSTASRIGPRAGAAARYSIQPGEELAGTVGYRATKAASSTKTADKLFPNQEPLIFSEEAAIRGGQKAVGKLRGLEYQDAKTRAQPSRLSQELTSARFKAEELLRSDAPTRVDTDINTRVGDRVRQEVASARFKAEEMVRSDGPGRMNSDINTPVVDRLRAEAKSAEFKGAEMKQSAADSVSGLRRRLDSFAGDDRGQAQIPRSRLRSESSGMELETELEMEMDSQRVRGPELETPRSELRSEMNTRPFETNVASAMDSPLGRMEQTQSPQLDVGAEITPRTRVEARSPLDIGGEMAAPRSENGLEQELGMEQELRSDTDLGLDLETELSTELESEFEMEMEMESDLEQELEGMDLRGDMDRRRRGRGSRTASSNVLERDLINPFTGE